MKKLYLFLLVSTFLGLAPAFSQQTHIEWEFSDYLANSRTTGVKVATYLGSNPFVVHLRQLGTTSFSVRKFPQNGTTQSALLDEKVVTLTGECKDIAIDANGNLFIVGFTSTAGLNAGASVGQSVKGALNDGFLMKLDINMDIVWFTYQGGKDNDALNSVAIDNEGRVHVGGKNENQFSIACFNNATGGRYQETKLTWTGVTPSGFDEVLGIAVKNYSTTQIAVYTTGVVYTDGWPGLNEYAPASKCLGCFVDGGEVFTAKHLLNIGSTNSYDWQWFRYFHGNANSSVGEYTGKGYGVAISKNDLNYEESVYVTGYIGEEGYSAGFVKTYGAYGAILNQKFIDATVNNGFTTIANDITIDNNNNIIVVGSTNATSRVSGGRWAGRYAYQVHQPVKGRLKDAFIIKYNRYLGLIWGTYYSPLSSQRYSNDDATGVAVDNMTQIYITGNIKYTGGSAPAIDAFLAKFGSYPPLRFWVRWDYARPIGVVYLGFKKTQTVELVLNSNDRVERDLNVNYWLVDPNGRRFLINTTTAFENDTISITLVAPAWVKNGSKYKIVASSQEMDDSTYTIKEVSVTNEVMLNPEFCDKKIWNKSTISVSELPNVSKYTFNFKRTDDSTSEFNVISPKNSIDLSTVSQLISGKSYNVSVRFHNSIDFSDWGPKCQITISETSGINNLVKSNVLIYPNPSKGLLNIELTEMTYSKCTVQILNSTGQIVLDEKLLEANSKFDIQHLSNGLYLVKVVRDGSILSIKRIVKQ